MSTSLLANAPLYPFIVKQVDSVAENITNFLTFLKENKKFKNYSDVEFIGLSLGAHVAGAVGYKVYARTHRKIGRITGLDPSGIIYL